MFDFLKRMFGEGVVYFECVAPTTGQKGSGQIEYIGEYDEDEVIKGIKAKVYDKIKEWPTDIVITHRTGF